MFQRSDQEGKNSTLKHIFANPYKAELCPLLALGLDVICASYRPDEGISCVFQGRAPDNRFEKALSHLLSLLTEDEIT